MIQELPYVLIEHNDTFVSAKVHRLAYSRVLADASLVAAGSAAKVIRGLATVGGTLRFNGKESIPLEKADEKGPMYLFEQVGLGSGWVHCRLRHRCDFGIMVDGPDDQVWLRELMRISTVPIDPSWVPYLRSRIMAEGVSLDPLCNNCDVMLYRVDDDMVTRFLVEGGTSGAIDLPECEVDFDSLSSLPDYIHAYAQKMVDSAGSALRPLLDPRHDKVSLPKLNRTPFTPQAWLIEAARRAMA